MTQLELIDMERGPDCVVGNSNRYVVGWEQAVFEESYVVVRWCTCTWTFLQIATILTVHT